MAPPLIVLLGALVLIPLGIVAVLYLVVPFFKAVGWVVRQVFRFVGGEIGDALRLIGAIITQVFLFPLVIGTVLIGRWSASGHYGRAIKSEFKTTLACVYRMLIGHPARLLCLTALTDGLENRLPEVVAAAPTSDRPRTKSTGQFEGYTIVGSLPGGGSGGKLYIAQPDPVKLAVFARNGRPDIRQVVIKTFSLRDGSSLPQIVRESRALEAAKRLGLVLEHELSDERFYYITEYVPGESLGLVTQRLHALSGGDGLATPQLRTALTYGADLLKTLDGYHRGGLWHKDVKPDNIIVDGQRAHLVDFGLVTPLRSGMTLTTHGTEYFRDPEMVRLALKGVKVHQVDGAKFDVFAAGAVVFSMIENSFPAHGGLSQISRRCPEALRWVVRRAMADYDKRYPNAAAMLQDLEAVRQAPDPFALKPVDLPSMRGVGAPAVEIPEDAPIRPVMSPVPVGAGSGAAAYGAAAVGAAPVFEGRRRPRLRVDRWWSGGYVVEDAPAGSPGFVRDVLNQAQQAVTSAAASIGGFGGGRGAEAANAGAWVRRPAGSSARQQIENARARVKAARQRARERMAARRGMRGDFRPVNLGVIGSAFIFVLMCIGAAALLVTSGRKAQFVNIVTDGPDDIGFAQVDLSEPGSLPSSTEAPVLVGARSKLPMPKLLVNGAPVGQPAAPMTVHGQRALVISDIVPLTNGMTAAVSRLSHAGFSVLGNYPGNPADANEATLQEELAVSARKIRDIGSLTAPDVSEALSRWVRSENEVDVLVWFAKPDPEKAAQAFVFGAYQDPTEPLNADSRDAVQAAIGALRSH